MILSCLVGKLGLQEKILAPHQARAISRCQSFAHAGLEVMASLVGCVNRSEAGANCEFRQL